MKLTISVVVLVALCYYTVYGCNKGNGRRKTTIKPGFNVRRNNGRDYGKFNVDISPEQDDVKARVGGHVDTDGNWGVHGEATITINSNRDKRSVTEGKHYNITLKVDPCNFYTYDFDRNGAIDRGEWYAIFGKNAEVKALFEDLDIKTGDGVVEEEEFFEGSSQIITECLGNED